MNISPPEADILSVLEHEKGSLTDPPLSNLLKKRGIILTAEERFDYVESLQKKGLVHAHFVRTTRGRAFSGLRIIGDGRTALRAMKP